MTRSWKVGLAVWSLILAIPGGALGTSGELDQSFSIDPNDGSGTSIFLRNENSLSVMGAQTLTVGLGGLLTCGEVFVNRTADHPETPPLILEVQETTGGLPNGNVLAAIERDPSTISLDPDWVSFDISGTPIGVEVGDVLALVLRVDPHPNLSSQAYTWHGEIPPNAGYEGGAGFSSVNGGAWSNPNSVDWAFRTYVLTTVPVLDASWGEVKNTFLAQ